MRLASWRNPYSVVCPMRWTLPWTCAPCSPMRGAMSWKWTSAHECWSCCWPTVDYSHPGWTPWGTYMRWAGSLTHCATSFGWARLQVTLLLDNFQYEELEFDCLYPWVKTGFVFSSGMRRLPARKPVDSFCPAGYTWRKVSMDAHLFLILNDVVAGRVASDKWPDSGLIRPS